jgi:hypothetical protein
MRGILSGGGSRRAKPGSAARLTQLAAGCVALGARPYQSYCPSRLGLASFASCVSGKRA